MRPLAGRLIAFNSKYGRPVRDGATSDLPPSETLQFVKKVREETSELIEAINLGDIVGIADGLGDAIYVLAGIAVQYGLDIDQIIDVVHRSNMTKDQSESGDALKGDAYKHPPLGEALECGELNLRSLWGQSFEGWPGPSADQR